MRPFFLVPNPDGTWGVQHGRLAAQALALGILQHYGNEVTLAYHAQRYTVRKDGAVVVVARTLGKAHRVARHAAQAPAPTPPRAHGVAPAAKLQGWHAVGKLRA